MIAKRLQAFLKDSDAATSVEYAVMLMLIIGACLIGIELLGGTNGGLWGGNAQQIEEAMGN